MTVAFNRVLNESEMERKEGSNFFLEFFSSRPRRCVTRMTGIIERRKYFLGHRNARSFLFRDTDMANVDNLFSLLCTSCSCVAFQIRLIMEKWIEELVCLSIFCKEQSDMILLKVFLKLKFVFVWRITKPLIFLQKWLKYYYDRSR